LLENILLAGHEPFLSALASLLLTGGPGLAIDFKKSALVKLSIKDLRASKCAVLEWMLTPRQLQELRK
jgi:phosphohistidine phosphatase SixA